MIQKENKSNQTNQPQTNQAPERYQYQRKYPRFSSVRLSHTNIEKIKSRASRFSQTIDDLVTIILGQLDYYERLGYETPKEEGSF